MLRGSNILCAVFMLLFLIWLPLCSTFVSPLNHKDTVRDFHVNSSMLFANRDYVVPLDPASQEGRCALGRLSHARRGINVNSNENNNEPQRNNEIHDHHGQVEVVLPIHHRIGRLRTNGFEHVQLWPSELFLPLLEQADSAVEKENRVCNNQALVDDLPHCGIHGQPLDVITKNPLAKTQISPFISAIASAVTGGIQRLAMHDDVSLVTSCSGLILRHTLPNGVDSENGGHGSAHSVHIDQYLFGEPLNNISLPLPPPLSSIIPSAVLPRASSVFSALHPFLRLLNVWIPLRTPNVRPLAVLDLETCVAKRDLVHWRDSNDRFYAVHVPDQLWCFDANMTIGDALLFDTTATPHASFSLPGENQLFSVRAQVQALLNDMEAKKDLRKSKFCSDMVGRRLREDLRTESWAERPKRLFKKILGLRERACGEDATGEETAKDILQQQLKDVLRDSTRRSFEMRCAVIIIPKKWLVVMIMLLITVVASFVVARRRKRYHTEKTVSLQHPVYLRIGDGDQPNRDRDECRSVNSNGHKIGRHHDEKIDEVPFTTCDEFQRIVDDAAKEASTSTVSSSYSLRTRSSSRQGRTTRFS